MKEILFFKTVVLVTTLYSCNTTEPNDNKTPIIEQNKSEEVMEEDPEFKIVKEYEMEEWGGAMPELTLRESGNAWLIVEVPPFEDGDGNELFDDEDFPEGLEFEKLISEYIGTEVKREDREIFIIENATEDQCLKTVEFFANYWENRKEEYKKKLNN